MEVMEGKTVQANTLIVCAARNSPDERGYIVQGGK